MTAGCKSIRRRTTAISHLSHRRAGHGASRDSSATCLKVAGGRRIDKIFATTSLLHSVTSMYPKKVDVHADHRLVLAAFSPPVSVEGRRRYRMPLQFLDDCNVVSNIFERLELLPVHCSSWETAHRILRRDHFIGLLILRAIPHQRLPVCRRQRFAGFHNKASSFWLTWVFIPKLKGRCTRCW